MSPLLARVSFLFTFLAHLPKSLTVQDGCRCSGLQSPPQVPDGRCVVQALWQWAGRYSFTWWVLKFVTVHFKQIYIYIWTHSITGLRWYFKNKVKILILAIIIQIFLPKPGETKALQGKIYLFFFNHQKPICIYSLVLMNENLFFFFFFLWKNVQPET